MAYFPQFPLLEGQHYENHQKNKRRMGDEPCKEEETVESSEDESDMDKDQS